MGEGTGKLNSAWRESVRSALKSLPAEYPAYVEAVEGLRHELLAEIAADLGPRMYQHFVKQPQRTLEEKRRIALQISHELKSLNLCVWNAVTQEPSALFADIGSDALDCGPSRFRLYALGTPGLRRTTFQKLPELTLIESPPRKESLSREIS